MQHKRSRKLIGHLLISYVSNHRANKNFSFVATFNFPRNLPHPPVFEWTGYLFFSSHQVWMMLFASILWLSSFHEGHMLYSELFLSVCLFPSWKLNGFFRQRWAFNKEKNLEIWCQFWCCFYKNITYIFKS